MCRLASTRLPASPRSVPAARTFLRDHLSRWAAERAREDAELVLTELVTNAVLHGEPPVEVTVGLAGTQLELVVVDASGVLPQPRQHRDDLLRDLDATLALEAGAQGPLHERDPRLEVGGSGTVAGGRGLHLVVALAEAWGASPLDAGKAVWARLPVAGWAPGGACTCSTDAGAVVLPSGLPVLHRRDDGLV